MFLSKALQRRTPTILHKLQKLQNYNVQDRHTIKDSNNTISKNLNFLYGKGNITLGSTPTSDVQNMFRHICLASQIPR